MITVFDLFMSAYQNTLLIYVLQKQLSQKEHSFLWEIGCVGLTVLLLFLIQYFRLPVPDSLIFLVLLAYIKLTSDEKFLTCLFWVAIDAFLMMGTLTLISSFFDISIGVNGDVLSASDETMIIYGFVGNTAITVVLSMAARINNVKNLITQKEVFLFFIMLLLTFFVSECFFSARISDDNQYSLLIGAACAFAVMILTIILYEHMIKSAQRQKQAEMSARAVQLSAEHQDELMNIYKRMMAEQHDLRHRIAAAEEILSATPIQEEERNQVHSLLQENTSKVFLTGSMAADAILMAKSAIMENAGIDFDFKEYPLVSLPISEQAFCVLIGNLLDNAIDGVMGLPAGAASRKIQLSFTKVWEMLFISCKNDADLSKVRQKGDAFLSTKANPELHGFGIENMKKIVNEAGGTIEFNLQDNHFSVEIMLGGSIQC